MNKLIEEIKKVKEVEAPIWAAFVKTSVHNQRPPVQVDWWHTRTASILSKINKFGPIGTNKLAKQYGGRKNRGHKPNKRYSGSTNIIRKCIQQLEKAGLVKQVEKPSAGKVVTKEGKELIKKATE